MSLHIYPLDDTWRSLAGCCDAAHRDYCDRVAALSIRLTEKYNLDVIIGPADSWFSKYSAATGTIKSLAVAFLHFDIMIHIFRIPALLVTYRIHRLQRSTSRTYGDSEK